MLLQDLNNINGLLLKTTVMQLQCVESIVFLFIQYYGAKRTKINIIVLLSYL